MSLKSLHRNHLEFLIRDSLGSLSMLRKNIKMKQNFPFLSTIHVFGQKLYYHNWVVTQWTIYIKREISIYIKNNYCIFQQL